MTIDYVAEATVGGCVPTSLVAFGSVEGNLNGQLAAQGNLKLTLQAGPPSVAVAASIAGQVQASVTSPTFSVGLSANVAAIAAIEAQLAALAGIFAALGAMGVHIFVYDGDAASFGGEVSAAIGGGLPGGAPTDHINAIILATQTPGTWPAMQVIFKVS